jgi:hypothetical protein
MECREHLHGSQESLPTTATMSAQPTAQPIKGRYILRDELGRGGFGVVYLAEDRELFQRRVVIKVLLHNPEHTAYSQKKFIEERAALALIDHPGVVGVLDAGEMPDGRPFLVLQYVDGDTLAKHIPAGGMPFPDAANCLVQIGSALSAAHEKGICHRDLKPDNVMLQRIADDEVLVKVIDFGIARLFAPEHQSIKSTLVAGTFPYMAPEQSVGESGPESDIFSLGVIAWQMLTGQVRGQLIEIAAKGWTDDIKRFRTSIPDGVRNLILSALAANPSERPKNAKQFTSALARALTATEQPAAPTQPSAGDEARLAHVLVVDVIDATGLLAEKQRWVMARLQEAVRSTVEFQRGRAKDQLLTIPSANGIALVFFTTPEAPAACALELFNILRNETGFKVRMGIHSDSVYVTQDMNGNADVSRALLLRAERIVGCGGPNHILISDSVAQVLRGLSRWNVRIHDAGLCRTKEGKLHLWNLYDPQSGNSARPPATASRDARPWVAAVILAGALGGGLYYRRSAQPPTVVTNAPAARQLSYSIRVRDLRGNVRAYDREMLFPPGYAVQLVVHATAGGYLYLFNEGPDGWVWLYPDTVSNSGSALINNGTSAELPFFTLDKDSGPEKIHMLWSAEALPRLENLKTGVFARVKREGVTGSALGSADAVQVQELISSGTQATTAQSRNATALIAPGKLLVKTITLEHM